MLIFDFDGVLLDSLDEVVVTAFNAVTGSAATTHAELPPTFIERFKKNRYHVGPAGDFLALAKWALSGEELHELTIEGFQAVLAGEESSLKTRSVDFFKTRGRFIRQAKEAWLKLQRPVFPLWERLQRIAPEKILILTNKNLEAVLELCQYFNLPVPKENIYSGEGGATKSANFLSIHARFPASDFTFLEDSVRNLIEMQKEIPEGITLKPLLAAWGYLGPADIKLAEEHGISIVTQETVIALLK